MRKRRDRAPLLQAVPAAPRIRLFPQLLHHRRAGFHDPLPLLPPRFRDPLQHQRKARASVVIIRRKISSAEKRLQLRRQPHRHRPSAAARRRLHKGHVDPIDIRPLFPIHLDRPQNPGSESPRSPRFRTIRAPSHGTSGRWNSRSKERSACSRAVPFQTLPLPTDTNPPDCGHAAANRGCVHVRGGSLPNVKPRVQNKISVIELASGASY